MIAPAEPMMDAIITTHFQQYVILIFIVRAAHR